MLKPIDFQCVKKYMFWKNEKKSVDLRLIKIYILWE